MYEEQFRETSKTVQSIDFNVNNLLKLFDKLEEITNVINVLVIDLNDLWDFEEDEIEYENNVIN